LYASLPDDEKLRIAPYIPHSRSQLAQDLFVVANFSKETPGFFVEFGATDGITMSNTYLLEKFFGWKGILAEPARTWHHGLQTNRSAIIDLRCVSNESNSFIPFLEVHSDGGRACPELSTIKEYAENGDWASSVRHDNSSEYLVETVSLNDLLDQHCAPPVIDYLSLDTEGSEYKILKGFDFGSRRIRLLTVEHNFHKYNRAKIHSLLQSHGYVRVMTELSLFDDWYIDARCSS
jgi:FkbM family methyltransferase